MEQYYNDDFGGLKSSLDAGETVPIQAGIYGCWQDWSGMSNGKCRCNGFKKMITKREESSWDWWDPVTETMQVGESHVHFHEDWRHYDFDVGLVAMDCDSNAAEHGGCHHRSEHGSDQDGKFYDERGNVCKRNCYRYEKFSNLLDPRKLEQETIPPVVTCPKESCAGEKCPAWGKLPGVRPVQFAPPVSRDPVQMKMRLQNSFGFESRLKLLQDPDFKLTASKVSVFVISEINAKGNPMYMGPSMDELISANCILIKKIKKSVEET